MLPLTVVLGAVAVWGGLYAIARIRLVARKLETDLDEVLTTTSERDRRSLQSPSGTQKAFSGDAARASHSETRHIQKIKGSNSTIPPRLP
jgi:hypothetical protein